MGKKTTNVTSSSKRGKRDAYSSSSSSEEDPQEILGKVSRLKNISDPSSSAIELRTKVERPGARVNGILVTNPINEDEIILFGGERSDGNKCEFYGDLHIFNVKSCEWTRLNLPVSPSPRSSHKAVILPDKRSMIIFGGEFGTSKETKFLHFSDTWIFDFTSYTWRALSLKVHPPSRSGHRMTLCGQYVVLFGGFFDTGKQARYLDDLWLFDTVEMEWLKVDWMNEYESRPSARSSFSLLPHPEGVLLYGGYFQVKGNGGDMKGQVLNDLWLLRFDPLDVTSLRWKKLKLTANAPMPRSGSSSVLIHDGNSMLCFGGVIDEDISEEFLLGTCLNDVNICHYETNTWEKSSLTGDELETFCPRYNAMLTTLGNGNVLVMGGIYEAGDRLFTLDDLHLLDPKQGIVQKLQAMSPALEGCWNIKAAPMSDSDGSSDVSDLDSDAETESDSNTDSENEDELKSHDEEGRPVPAAYTSLKEFFDGNTEYWFDLASQEAGKEGETNDKRIRSLAFQLAKAAWEHEKNLNLNLSLN